MEKTLKQKEALLKVNKAKRLTTQQFIDKARLLHGDKFDYSITQYVNATTKLKIICIEHGEQEMLPHHHTHSKSYGCPVCGKQAINNYKQFTTESFIEKVSHIKGISFEKTIYISKRENVTITCDIHGDYETKAEMLLKNCGCPRCKSSKGEDIIEDILIMKEVNYIKQMTFPNCIYVNRLKFDFYIPILNLCIEFDGEQHFKSVKYWGGDVGLVKRQNYDKIKTEFCKENNISLLRISYLDNIKEKLDTII